MSDDLEQRIITISVQMMILRDFVVWLLVREIKSARDPEELVRLASEFADARIRNLPNGTKDELQMAEEFQREKDWIISAVSKALNI